MHVCESHIPNVMENSNENEYEQAFPIAWIAHLTYPPNLHLCMQMNVGETW